MYRNETFIQKYWWWGAIIAFVILIAYIVWPRQYVAEIIAVEWTRYYQIQALRTVKEYDEESPLPNGARIFNSDSERRCTHNGKSETCRWVTEYDYEIEKFVNNRVVAVNGMFPSEPYWPEYTLSGPNGQPYGVGQERVGNAVERYTLTFKSKEGTIYTDDLPMVEWKLYEPHQFVYITTSLGYVTKIRQLEN